MISTQAWRNQRERRFHLDAAGVPALVGALGEELPVVTYAPGTTRTLVVTTYLDSSALDYLRQIDRTAGHRSIKMRVREYIALHVDHDGAPQLVAAPTCYLERKERVGQIRLKQRIEIPKSIVAAVLRREIELAGDDEVVKALRAEVSRRALQPVLVSGYLRREFGADGGLRVTLDEHIEFFRPPAALYEGSEALTPAVLGEAADRGPAYLVEVKEPHGSFTPPWLERVMAGLEPADHFSKFREGMRCLGAADDSLVDDVPRARASGD
ncbi:MAG TPA: VTC domain-containing protein [Kofleriaceae bacterium]|nr:VTC domain-containing protein [Kofleriaceae bacterium]